jgi:LPS-assembly lipoprotein
MSGLATLRNRFVAAALMAAMFALSACTVTPLYSAGGVPGVLQAELASISILPVSDRLPQIVRNDLIFAFGSNSSPANPKYEMSISAGTGGAPNVPTPAITLVRVTVTVRYTLREIASGDVVASGSTSATTNYQTSNQAFANLRAREDAEARAASAAADTVRVEVAAALAARL